MRLLNTLMQRFRVHTLFDITETSQHRKDPGREIQWKQQQNFSVLLQTIGMRVNPQYNSSPSADKENLTNYQFGSAYNDEHTVWTWEFFTEYDNGFTDSLGNPVGLLLEHLNFVPMIPQLTETVQFKIPVFDSTSLEFRNILVYAL